MRVFLLFILSLFAILSCDTLPDLSENAQISSCGGFEQETVLHGVDEEEYCKDELFTWTYNEESKTLSFINKNVWLNCCGDHSLRVEKKEGKFIIHEKDAPEGGDARCSCMCFFDFKADISISVDATTIDIEIHRFITDSDSGDDKVWEATVDLSQRTGVSTIKEHIGWCD